MAIILKHQQNQKFSNQILWLLGGFWIFPAYAEQQPLWELGAGISAFQFQDYRGSDHAQVYALPIPYFVYRGQYLKADRAGIRSVLYSGKRVKLKLSMNGTVPVDSEENSAREGMPDLRSTAQIGTTLNINLGKSKDKSKTLDLRMPVLTPFTIETSPRTIGWTFEPRLNLDFKDVLGFTGWNLGLGFGVLFADKRYHSYFYDVEPEFETENRPAYTARTGYSGSNCIASLSKRYQKHWVGAFMRYDTLKDAVFEDSPLAKKSYAITAGIGFTWIFRLSERYVDVEP